MTLVLLRHQAYSIFPSQMHNSVYMTEQLATSGLIWNRHQPLVKSSVLVGGTMAACGLSQAISTHWELCTQAQVTQQFA